MKAHISQRLKSESPCRNAKTKGIKNKKCRTKCTRHLSLSILDFCLSLSSFLGGSPGIIGGGGGMPGMGGGAGMLPCDNFLIEASLTRAFLFFGTS